MDSTNGFTVAYADFGFAELTIPSLSFTLVLPGLGLLISVLPRKYDQKLFTRYHQDIILINLETEVTFLLTACPALAVGLWLFAWSIPPLVSHVHEIVSMVGLVLVGCSTDDLSYMLFGYLTGSYGPLRSFCLLALLSVCRARSWLLCFYCSNTPCTLA